ncbi:MAG: hypothetical protein J5I98_20040 [Phaeodactylibacter sp.]|nr:hypothetical protein [Phaeodactylibacter sp.]
MHQTTIRFPDLRLSRRDGHKLRGYFAEQFGEQSDLWHNHRADGRAIYRYPLIQYKVIGGQPMVIGLGEGAGLLIGHFMEVRELRLDERTYTIHAKQIESRDVPVGVNGQLHTYEFCSPWFALSQDNYRRYQEAEAPDRPALLQQLLAGHILALFKGIGHWEEQHVMVAPPVLRPVSANFKNRKMLMFMGSFSANVHLPDYAGLGKSVARGFGAIKKS